MIVDLLGTINTQLKLYKEGLVHYLKYENTLSWVNLNSYEWLN